MVGILHLSFSPNHQMTSERDVQSNSIWITQILWTPKTQHIHQNLFYLKCDAFILRLRFCQIYAGTLERCTLMIASRRQLSKAQGAPKSDRVVQQSFSPFGKRVLLVLAPKLTKHSSQGT